MLHGAEAGGLSGAPVFQFSNTVIRLLKAELGDAADIIGVGGIMQGSDAKVKMDCGAQLVQLYSGLIRRPGPHQGLRGRLTLKERTQKVQLGNSHLNVTKICLGTMTWGEQNTEAEAHSQLDYAVERGINFIDTAEMYPVMVRARNLRASPSATSAAG
jgi:hypothetical protein